VAGIETKSFDEPDELLEQPLVTIKNVVLGELHIAWRTYQPGWQWSVHMRPIVGTASCMHHHQGIQIAGRMEVTTDGGARRVVEPGEVYDIPPGHDGRVLGDEPVVCIEFAGARGWGKAPASERVVATLLVTDIVESTSIAARMGDADWKTLLGHNSDRVRAQLDRFRGIEVDTTGDGFLAIFDGAARAVTCAAAIRQVSRADGLEVRAGVHSGEVERDGRQVRGVAVHAATRVAALAGAGEVLVSEAAAALLEGSGVLLEDAGEHELRGLPGRRRLHRLADDRNQS
jgi:class 3 adenylate cyclase